MNTNMNFQLGRDFVGVGSDGGVAWYTPDLTPTDSYDADHRIIQTSDGVTHTVDGGGVNVSEFIRSRMILDCTQAVGMEVFDRTPVEDGTIRRYWPTSDGSWEGETIQDL